MTQHHKLQPSKDPEGVVEQFHQKTIILIFRKMGFYCLTVKLGLQVFLIKNGN